MSVKYLVQCLLLKVHGLQSILATRFEWVHACHAFRGGRCLPRVSSGSTVRLVARGSQLAAFLFLVSCIAKKELPLPVFGEREVVGADTVYHTIADFKFLDQDSSEVTNETFRDKIYVADFFFTSCRTICPIMKTQMLRVYDSVTNDPDVLLLSHTIDPDYDTVGLLHDFADRLGVKSNKWHFVTGNKDDIYKIAQTSYFSTALEDKTEADGFIHSGAFLLIDKARRIRGKYDGTKEEDVNRLLHDIQRLKKEDESI